MKSITFRFSDVDFYYSATKGYEIEVINTATLEVLQTKTIPRMGSGSYFSYAYIPDTVTIKARVRSSTAQTFTYDASKSTSDWVDFPGEFSNNTCCTSTTTTSPTTTNNVTTTVNATTTGVSTTSNPNRSNACCYFLKNNYLEKTYNLACQDLPSKNNSDLARFTCEALNSPLFPDLMTVFTSGKSCDDPQACDQDLWYCVSSKTKNVTTTRRVTTTAPTTTGPTPTTTAPKTTSTTTAPTVTPTTATPTTTSTTIVPTTSRTTIVPTTITPTTISITTTPSGPPNKITLSGWEVDYYYMNTTPNLPLIYTFTLNNVNGTYSRMTDINYYTGGYYLSDNYGYWDYQNQVGYTYRPNTAININDILDRGKIMVGPSGSIQNTPYGQYYPLCWKVETTAPHPGTINNIAYPTEIAYGNCGIAGQPMTLPQSPVGSNYISNSTSGYIIVRKVGTISYGVT